ncbi:cell wall-binding protein YocH precursor [Peptococcaceae bacterium CEB3]|nr:cell wall-binding protein YocH precursor [Peptococcaceae bacterium CEB3]
MYSLPISTYTDYWRTTKLWSTYFGTAIALVAGTSFLGTLSKAGVPAAPAHQVQPVGKSSGSVTEAEPGSGRFNRLTLQRAAPPAQPKAAPTFVAYRTQEIPLPVPVEYRETRALPPGMKEILAEGSQGTERRVFKVVRTAGRVRQTVVEESVLAQPQKRVILQNSKTVPGEPADVARLRVTRAFTVEATAYTYTGNPTASGVYPHRGLIAVDPRVIPMGSRVYVEGYGYAVAADTGGAILGKRIDLFFPSERECIDWGRRPIKIYLLKAG